MKKIFLFFCVIGTSIVVNGSAAVLPLERLPIEYTKKLLLIIWTSPEYTLSQKINVALVCKDWLQYMREYAYTLPNNLSWSLLRHNTTILNHGAEIDFLILENDEGMVISGSQKLVKIWDAGGNCMGESRFQEPIEFIQGAYIGNKKMMAIGLKAGDIILCSIKSAQMEKYFSHAEEIDSNNITLECMIISYDGRWLFCGLSNGDLFIWDIERAQILQRIMNNLNIKQISMSEDNMHFVMWEGKRTISLWSWNNDNNKFTRSYIIEMKGDEIISMAMYKNTPIIAMTSGKIYQIKPEGYILNLTDDRMIGKAQLEFLPCTATILVVSDKRIATIALEDTDEPSLEFKEQIQAYHMSYEEELLAVAREGKISLIDMESKKEITRFQSTVTEGYPIIISLDIKTIINDYSAGNIVVRRLQKPKKERVHYFPDQNIHYLD